ncbi:DENN domain-containing protein 1B [Amia ocellicauda]|uniref:DENN domain-containing protein 1B n=1 Tax=Amia ocellicauda TaxID=2972642 RepID=UPI003463CBCB
MGSRIKDNPEGTFCWFFEASCPIAKDKDPGVLFQFPEDFSDQDSLQTLPRFCFPYDIERVKECPAVQHFTFVLTDLEGNQRFGFCRLTSSSRTCLCILSYLPWFEVFYKLLNNLADYLTKGQKNEMRELLSALYKLPIPQPDSPVILQYLPYFIAPDVGSLPTIPESRNLTELVVAMDVNNMLHLYASMLLERRILITSSKLSTLTACVHASSALLFPMYWQHIYIPVLPPHLIDYCCAPMPYLIGVHSSLMERVKSRALEDVVILNVDTNTLESPFEDLKKIPSDVVSLLKMKLKKQSAATGDGVARAFLRSQALLFGGYRDALVCESGDIAFCEESFLNHKSNTMKQFLENAVHLQFFKQFIDSRLEKLNTGKEFADVFEDEITHCLLTAGGSKSYQQWVGNLKKGGGALIFNVKSKANPAVLNMYKCAKGHAKTGLKEMKSRLTHKESKEERWLQRGGSLHSEHGLGPQFQRRAQSDCLQNRLPITQHFGKSRPRRPTRRFTSPLEEKDNMDRNSTWALGWDEDCGTPDGEGLLTNTEAEDPDNQFFSEEMDLLGEIFDTLSSQTSQERGLLYGTRSLDVFNADNGDYITRLKSVTPSNESLVYPSSQTGSQLSWELDEGEEVSLEHKELTPEENPTVDMTIYTKSSKDLPSPCTLDVPHTLGCSKDAEGKISPRNSGMWDRGLTEEEKGIRNDDSPLSPKSDKSTSAGIPWQMRKERKDQLESDKEAETLRKEESENPQSSEDISKKSDVQGLGGSSTTEYQQMDEDHVNLATEFNQESGLQVYGKDTGSFTVCETLVKDHDKCLEAQNPGMALMSLESAAELDVEATKGSKPQPPSVQSAVAIFQAKVTKQVPEGKSQTPSISTNSFPGLNKIGSIYQCSETTPGIIPMAHVSDTSENGRLVAKTSNQETVVQDLKGLIEPLSPTKDGVVPIVKVSELKKRFES